MALAARLPALGGAADVRAVAGQGYGFDFGTESHLWPRLEDVLMRHLFWRMKKKALRPAACAHFLPAVPVGRAVSNCIPALERETLGNAQR